MVIIVPIYLSPTMPLWMLGVLAGLWIAAAAYAVWEWRRQLKWLKEHE